MGECNWIFSMPGLFPVVKCNKPVAYRMVKDDDGNRVRRYDNLCSEHKKRSEALEALEGEDV